MLVCWCVGVLVYALLFHRIVHRMYFALLVCLHFVLCCVAGIENARHKQDFAGLSFMKEKFAVCNSEIIELHNKVPILQCTLYRPLYNIV